MASDDDRTSVERVTPKSKVLQLYKRKSAMNSRIGEERASYGAAVEKAVESEYLDKVAFDVVTRLAKMDAGKAARHFRNIEIYAEHLGIGAQGDLEDKIDEEKKGAVDKTLAGFEQPSGTKIKQTASTLHPEKALKRFEGELAEAIDADTAQVLMQAFVSKHQDLAEQAEKLTETRITALASTPKKSSRKAKPQSPATEASREFGYQQ